MHAFTARVADRPGGAIDTVLLEPSPQLIGVEGHRTRPPRTWVATPWGLYDPQFSDGRALVGVEVEQLHVTHDDGQMLLKRAGRDPAALDRPSVSVHLPEWAQWEAIADALNERHPEYSPRLAAALHCWIDKHRDGRRDSARTTPKMMAWLAKNWPDLVTKERSGVAYVALPERVSDKGRKKDRTR